MARPMLTVEETENSERRQEEISALNAIFDDKDITVETVGSLTCITIAVDVTLNDSMRVIFKEPHLSLDAEENSSNCVRQLDANTECVEVQFLPPLLLGVQLPPSYPGNISQAPYFEISCCWLDPSQRHKLCREFDSIWDTVKAGILFDWVQFLQSELMHFLELTEIRVDSVSRDNFSRDRRKVGDQRALKMCLNCPKTAGDLYNYLIEFSDIMVKQNFRKEFHECLVCGDSKIGENCVYFSPCKHVFCHSCTDQFFTININDGAVKSCKCLDSDCPTEPPPLFVKSIVSEKTYQKYDELLLKVALDSMSDIVACPASTCGLPVIAESDSNLAMCQKCYFSFCKRCLKAYHGVAKCEYRSDAMNKIRETYEAGDVTVRQNLIKQYGESALLQILNESKSMQWVNEHSRNCPNCHCVTQKSAGCNKMWCARCSTHWCWLCCESLRKQDPYLHFNKPGTNCFQRLFEGVDKEEMQQHFQVEDDQEDDDDFILEVEEDGQVFMRPAWM